jgi:hypothetical protein
MGTAHVNHRHEDPFFVQDPVAFLLRIAVYSRKGFREGITLKLRN